MKKEFMVLLLLPGCGGSFAKKKQIANSHYRQASLDAKEYQETKNIGTLRKALNEIEQAVALNATPQFIGLRATILLQLGELAQSKAAFERILNNSRTSHAKRADARNNYAAVLYQMGMVQEAQRVWLDLVSDPHYISPEVAYFNLGYSELNEANKIGYREKNQLAPAALAHVHSALAYFKNALAISHDYVDALFFLGQAHIVLDKFQDARDCFVTILTINPDHAGAQQVLSVLEQKLAQEKPV